MESKDYHKQYQARNLYLHTDKTQKEIADILDVNSKTLYLWIKHNRWEEIKIAARQAPMCMVQDMYNHISAINDSIYSREDKCPTPKEVDMLKKLAGTAKLLEAKNLGLYTETFMELISFIRASNPSLAFDVTAIADRYIKAKITKMQRFTPGDDLRAAQENLKEQEAEEEEEMKKHKATVIAAKEPVPNAVGGATSHQAIETVEPHQTIQPLSHCALEPLKESRVSSDEAQRSRASSGITHPLPKPTETNAEATSQKNKQNSIPEKTEFHNMSPFRDGVATETNSVASSQKNEHNPMPEQQKKYHHHNNHRIMKRA